MFCKKCGKALNEKVSFCKNCGAEVPTALKKEKVFSDGYESYARFWPRFGAYITDLSILFVATVIVLGIFESPENDWIFWIFFIAYHTFYFFKYSATPGKMLFGLKVVQVDGDEPSFLQSLGRSFAYLVSGCVLGIGFLNIAFDAKHRGWHDMLAHTFVLQRKKWNRALAILISVGAFITCMAVVMNSPSNNSTTQTSYDYSNSETVSNDSNTPPNIEYGSQPIPNNELPSVNEITNLRKQANSDALGRFDIRKNLGAVVSIICKTTDDEWVHGSGVIFSEYGLILTNYHVIENAFQSICAVGFTSDISEEPTYMYLTDADFRLKDETIRQFINEDLDVAVIRIVAPLEGYSLPDSFPYIANIGNSSDLSLNDKIYVVGYPSYGGGTITSTEGVVSGRVGTTYIKTSAKIDAGNSGGAAFNEKGEYIGLPTFIISGLDDALGYIVGIDSVQTWLDAELE